METTSTFTDKATTVLGIIVVLWVLLMKSGIVPEQSLDFKEAAAFVGLAVFLIIFKGQSAREFFASVFNRLVPKRNAKSTTD